MNIFKMFCKKPEVKVPEKIEPILPLSLDYNAKVVEFWEKDILEYIYISDNKVEFDFNDFWRKYKDYKNYDEIRNFVLNKLKEERNKFQERAINSELEKIRQANEAEVFKDYL